MNHYYFTFSNKHTTITGIQLFGSWVRVRATDTGKAYRIMEDHFKPLLKEGTLTAWCRCYSEDGFRAKTVDKGYQVYQLFPGGEHAFLDEMELNPATSTPELQKGQEYTFYLVSSTKQEPIYTMHTRDAVVYQIDQLKKMGWDSRCVYSLDGSIDLCLVHPSGPLMFGTYFTTVQNTNSASVPLKRI